MKKLISLLLALCLALSLLPAALAGSVQDYSGRTVNILVSCVDSEQNAKAADAMLLFSINTADRTITATSFLRDTYVKLPDYRGHEGGWNRLSSAYALGNEWAGTAGAMELLDLTLAENFGITVDGNVELGSDVFIALVDMLGGLYIGLSGSELAYMQSISDRNWGCGFYEGVNCLSGLAALEYVKMRTSDLSDNDINRTARQRTVTGLLLNALRYDLSAAQVINLMDALLPMVITNISTDEMKALLCELIPCLMELQFSSARCPADGSCYLESKELPEGPGAVLVIYDRNANLTMLQQICG